MSYIPGESTKALCYHYVVGMVVDLASGVWLLMLFVWVRSQQVHLPDAHQLILISSSLRAIDAIDKAYVRLIGSCIHLFRFGDKWPWPETKAPEGKFELVFWHLKRLMFIIPKTAIAFLPKRFHTWTWFTVRFTFKLQVSFKRKLSRKRKRQSLQAEPGNKVAGFEKDSSANDETLHPLARFLYWDILILVAQDLHYSDLISISLTSKQMRETILPRTDRQVRLSLLKKYTLDAKYTGQCDVCGVPACDVSSFLPLFSVSIH